MRLSNRYGLVLMAGGMLCLARYAGAVPVYDSVTIPLTITTTAPSCTVDVPAEVQLGTIVIPLTPQLLPPFPTFAVSVNCPSSVKMEVYAQALTPLKPGSRTTMHMEGGSGARSELAMRVGQEFIYLDGDSSPADTGFCAGSDTRTCDVQPIIDIPGNVEPGERTAAIRFNVRYKS